MASPSKVAPDRARMQKSLTLQAHAIAPFHLQRWGPVASNDKTPVKEPDIIRESQTKMNRHVTKSKYESHNTDKSSH